MVSVTAGTSVLLWTGYHPASKCFVIIFTAVNLTDIMSMHATNTYNCIQGIFWPSLGVIFSPLSQSKIATFFPNTMSVFPI